jgi:hypothetical protein
MGESYIVRKGGTGATGGSDLYVFSSHIFTNATATGRTGPTLAQCRTAYSSASWTQNSSFFNMTTQGIQEWTVPANGNYRIEARGGRGGRDVNPGNAAVMRGDFSLTKGQVLKLLVGQQGIPNLKDGTAAGGGGGSFVANSSNQALLVAGGGGGADGGPPGQNASTGQNGVSAPSGGAGGTNGNGGGDGNNGSGGGGGFFGNGENGSIGNGGSAFVNGGNGGAGARDGGFGGGGGSAGGSSGGGGGGGYSGGGGGFGSGTLDAGGGGSFNNGANQANSIFPDFTNPYDGYISITKL